MPDFVPTFWNTLTQHNGPSRTSKVSSGQVAYKKKNNAWALVNSGILQNLTATEFPGDVQFPKNAQDWVVIHFNSEYSAKRQVTEGKWQNSEDEFVMRIRVDCPTNSVGIIDGAKPWQVKYSNAFGPGVHLIYGIWEAKTARFEHVIEVTEMPPGDSEYLEYDFYVESNDATVFVGANHSDRPWAGNSGDGATVKGFSVFLAKGNDPATPRGAVLRTPVCWWEGLDGTLVRKPVRVDFEIQPDKATVKATKYVKRSDIAEALSQGSVYRADVTFNPDPSPETTSVDGFTDAFNRNEPWADIITAPGGNSSDSVGQQNLRVWAKNVTDNWEYLSHLHFLFDTSSIGSGQSVDSASLTLSLYRSASDDLGFNWNVYSSNPASNTALVNGDHDSLGTTAFSTAREVVTEHWDWTSIAMTFNTDGKNAVDMEGVSKFGIAMQEDRENGTYGDPTWVISDRSAITVRMAENSGTTNDPLLTVTHSASSSGSPHYYYQNNQNAS